MDNKFLIANISWNPTGWRNMYINPKAGHKYAREFPGHESLNFKFDKKNIDTENEVYGFIQWQSKPVRFENGGIIIFYSNNTDERKGQIVGIYSNVEILKNRKKNNWKGFQNNLIELNIKAKKSLSLLFPIPLEANSYKEDTAAKRLTGQIGYSYYDISLAERIVKDELIALSKSGAQINEFNKLKNIYEYITGDEFDLRITNTDDIEQQELINFYKKEINKTKIKEDLSNLEESETVYVNQRTYKRDNKTISQLKIIRDFKCQICGTKISKKNGDFYIEAAHIKPKHKKGCETPENILILCPNHHKEFDYGNRIIIQHSKEQIRFKLNGIKHKIDLKI